MKFPAISRPKENSYLLEKSDAGVRKMKSSRRYHIELFFLLSSAGLTLVETVLPNFVEVVYCGFAWNLSENECFDPRTDHFAETQKFSSTFTVVYTCINMVFSMGLYLFVGPWSDIHGRKLLIIIPAIGFSITGTLMTLASLDHHLNPWILLLYCLPSLCTGGKFMQFFGGFCSVCDVSTDDQRNFSLGIFQASIYAGAVFSNWLGVLVLPYGYTVLFTVTTLFNVVALLPFTLLHEETVSPQQIDPSSPRNSVAGKNIFQLSYLKEIYASYCRNDSKDRLVILLNILTRFIYTLGFTGEERIMYYFLQWKLGITVQAFAQYLIFDTIGLALVAVIGSWVQHYKSEKFSDTYVLIIIVISQLVHTFPIIFSNSITWIYCSIIFRAIGGLFIPVHKSAVSKIVGKDNIGKILAVSDFGEALGGNILGTIIYTVVYQMTLLFFPAMSFVVSIILNTLVIFILGYILVIDKTYDERSKMIIP